MAKISEFLKGLRPGPAYGFSETEREFQQKYEADQREMADIVRNKAAAAEKILSRYWIKITPVQPGFEDRERLEMRFAIQSMRPQYHVWYAVFRRIHVGEPQRLIFYQSNTDMRLRVIVNDAKEMTLPSFLMYIRTLIGAKK